TYPDLPADFTYLQVSAGYHHSLAVGSDGNVYAWGYNGNGQLGDGTRSSRTTPVRVKTPDRKTYPDLPADFTYLQVSAGGDHQPLARAAEPGSAFTVRFDTGGGNPTPADQTVLSPYGRAKRPSPDPAREGFLFDGWFIGEVAYDFSRPVGKDLTLAAHWTP
ncbi:InlB B-repeat-containing protein, partial [Bifidobacterium sp. H1HS10N]|uniref:InlB B-repeat-containing protein n=1 Tax=Bifidobacterium kimbladii TaxID=1293826 RepID=UPI0028BD5062